VSKNVAVFVDVANIFYAAKAAGVDIDYVTLLKSAIAGRDFVRAYAYTGLDPENENQRQFHQFLSRSGYKVVSKDIRKYGDGKIKANLDIELVVDLLRTAQNLDIAVVVSGDGDFAPAIRAVQQMGVRVEVISFRGNTSSDLIDVADVFTDIAQVARVEKGSSRSGRRVAGEGDLSMTEVPDKETEGAPRRRRAARSRSAEREPAAARPAATRSETGAMPGNLIVLPGEKLSRASATADASGESEDEAEGSGAVAENDSGRRRRRRRGGRGRGRGRPEAPLGVVPVEEEEEEGAEYQTPRLPQASTFGSVWDSQLGVPTSVPVSSEPLGGDEELEEEPAIPEYLLAERRQRGGGRGPRPTGGRGARSAYQSAVERERFGRGATRGGAFGGGYGGPRADERGERRRRGGRQGRGDRGRGAPDRQAFRPSPTGDPWSEVPPELEELLRAQIAQKGQRPEAAQSAGGPTSDGAGEAPADYSAAGARSDGEATEGTTRSRRGSRAAAVSAAAGADADEADASATDAEAPKRRTRRTTAKAAEGATATRRTSSRSKTGTTRKTTRARTSTDDAE
jgi:uncharacterized LabA/DUF88 family protein